MTPEQENAVLSLWGIGSLKEAVRPAWPWWRCWYGSYEGDHENQDDCEHQEAYIPNFPTDDAAAVKLAERMMLSETRYHFEVSFWKNGYTLGVFHDNDFAGEFQGATLGAALLSALELA